MIDHEHDPAVLPALGSGPPTVGDQATGVLTIADGANTTFCECTASTAEKGKKSSSFAGTHERLAKQLDPKTVEVSAEVEGKPYVFRLDEHHGEKK